MENIDHKSEDSINESPSVNDVVDDEFKPPASKGKNKKKLSKLNFNVINKLLSSMKSKQKSKKKNKSETKPYISTITPSYHSKFQTWNINITAAPLTKDCDSLPTPIINQNISRNTPISISIYEIPTIKTFNVEFKYAPYYYLGYGFYGNPYDKNGKECNLEPIITINKMVNIYDKIAISFNKESNEIITWINGKQDSENKKIEIDNNKEYQFIIESLDQNYHIKVN